MGSYHVRGDKSEGQGTRYARNIRALAASEFQGNAAGHLRESRIREAENAFWVLLMHSHVEVPDDQSGRRIFDDVPAIRLADSAEGVVGERFALVVEEIGLGVDRLAVLVEPGHDDELGTAECEFPPSLST